MQRQSISIITLSFLLVAFVSAAPSQPEQVSNAVNPGEYQLLGIRHQPPSELLDGTHLTMSEVPHQLVPSQAGNSVQPQSSPVQVVNQAPSVVQPAVIGGPVPQGAVVEGVQSYPPGEQVNTVHHQQHPSVPSYYNTPAGLVTVVGNEPAVVGQNKPVSSVRNYEQYGQPEPAALPPNYKPFGSWGLYIGGNPADGYYTNYYKALSNSVDKQQTGEVVKPVLGSQTAAFSPILRQASSSPYVGNDYYSFAYSPSDLNSAGRVGVEPVHHVPAQVLPASQVVSPVQAGAQVYGSPASFESNYGVSPYADAFATKKVGAAYVQREATKEVPLAPPSAPKGYQSRVYVYPSPVVGPMSAPAQVVPQQQQAVGQQQQLVAYPVPVGSQIVGSQPGVDGSFDPYGVHAFTRYAVKPTLLSQEHNYFVQSPNQQLPAYKQQVYAQQTPGNSYYPYGSYYGYPLNQLHYSQGSVGPSVHVEPHHGPAQANQIEAASEKSESEDKSQVIKQQKRA